MSLEEPPTGLVIIFYASRQFRPGKWMQSMPKLKIPFSLLPSPTHYQKVSPFLTFLESAAIVCDPAAGYRVQGYRRDGWSNRRSVWAEKCLMATP